MMKEKHRWVLIEVIGDKVSKDELRKAINQKIYELFGTIYGSKITYKIISYDEVSKIGIIRINLDALDMFRTAILFIRNIEGNPVLINDLLVSGTLKALQRKLTKIETWTKRINKEKEKF